jgi:anti-sigma factor ChrR (cupin superfamily)
LHFSGGASLPHHDCSGGAEIFVLDGALEDDEGSYAAGGWLRLPDGCQYALRSKKGCTLYIKRGHLAAPD